MAEIRVNVTASKSQRVNVSSSNIATEITATPDTSQYYSNLAKNWAIAENIVDGKDYSSKHYAKEAQQASELANTYKQATEQAYISFSEQYANAETELTALKDAGVQEINTAVTDGKTEITTTKDLAIDAVNNTKTTILQDIEFVADGEKEEIRDLADDIKENASDIINRVSLSMFDTILKDHVLTYEESKGLALQGSYVYKEAVAGSRYGYPDFYNKVLEEYNEATNTETVNGATVKVHSNGHKFYDITNKDAIDNFYNTMGSAWFYGVDTENERIFLPRDNNQTHGALVDSYVSGVNWYRIYSDGWCEQGGTCTTAGANTQFKVNLLKPFANTNYSIFTTQRATNGLGDYANGMSAYPNTTSAFYGKAGHSEKLLYQWRACGYTSVEQNFEAEKYTYICVGNTTNYEGVTDVVNQGIEILEQVAQKVNIDGTNLNSEGKSLIAGYAMPSNKYIDLTLGASGSSYTAPANGYILFRRTSTSAGQFLQLVVHQSGIQTFVQSGTSSGVIGGYIPVKKGDLFGIGYTLGSATNQVFRFIYAEGEQ